MDYPEFTKENAGPLCHHARTLKDPGSLVEFALVSVSHGFFFIDILSECMKNPVMDPNLRAFEGHTLLTYACLEGFEEAFNVLISHPKIDVNITTNQGSSSRLTPLMILASYDYFSWSTKTMKRFLARPDLDFNATELNGKTAIMCAAVTRSERVFKLLIQHPGVNVNHKDNFEDTILLLLLHMRSRLTKEWDGVVLTMVELLFTRPEFQIDDLEYALEACTQYASFESTANESLADVIKRFHSDPLGTSIEMKAKHGMLPHVELFCLMEFEARDASTKRNPGLALFKRVFDRLPIELKMRMCNLAYGANVDYITQKEIDCVMLQGKI